MRRLVLVPVVLLGLIALALLLAGLRIGNWFGGSDPESIASASLQSMREQARLTPFTARFVSVVTSTQTRMGLRAQKTLIMPGTVRYEIDLARLGERDLRWDAEAERLTIILPPLELAGPEINLGEIQEYTGGRLLMALTDAEQTLDQANRNRGREELLRQARSPVPMRLARDAARRAVARSFALPLRAAGIEADVAVRFADEAGSEDPSYLDRSRRVEDVLQERQGAR